MLYFAFDIAELDAIAHRDRTLEHDDEPADEIADDLLQTEADTDADSTGENGERGELDAESLQYHHGADNEQRIAHDRHDRPPRARVELRSQAEPPVEERSEPPRKHDEQQDQRDDLQETEESELGVAEGEQRDIQVRDFRDQKAEFFHASVTNLSRRGLGDMPSA